MNKKAYHLYSPVENFYIFTSQGKNGDIQKAIAFQEIEMGLYNLALVDYHPETQSWSDVAHSNNGDLPKIMATVVQVIKFFLENRPTSIVYLEGNTKAKQKLYNRIVANYHSEFSEEFTIFVEEDEQKRPYEMGMTCNSFFIHLKIKE